MKTLRKRELHNQQYQRELNAYQSANYHRDINQVWKTHCWRNPTHLGYFISYNPPTWCNDLNCAHHCSRSQWLVPNSFNVED